MDPFDAAQAADPFDPSPTLIRADWLEERGDPVGAEVLRGLASSGVPSIAALALDVGSESAGGYFGRGDVPGRDATSGWGEGDAFLGGGGIDDGLSSGRRIGAGALDPSGGGDGMGDGVNALNPVGRTGSFGEGESCLPDLP